MINLEWPWLLLALPLPILYRVLLPAASLKNEAALQVPILDDFAGNFSTNQHLSQSRGYLGLAIITWILLVTAATRPQWVGDPINIPVSGRDLMMAVDLSGSMEVKDFQVQNKMVDRLTATQAVASSFIERRIGDRIGLILFGRNAYLQSPLTFDRKTVKILLNEAVIGLAGKETAIGDAIGLAIKRLRDHEKNRRLLILLTDGANTAGEISPLKAADLAAAEGLKIYTIGIGADEMLVRSLFGSRKVNPSADLDEKTLSAIANKTGGKYFRARNTAELDEIYQLLDELEPVEKETQVFRPRKSLYFYPLGAALLLASLFILLKSIRLTPFRTQHD